MHWMAGSSPLHRKWIGSVNMSYVNRFCVSGPLDLVTVFLKIRNLSRDKRTFCMNTMYVWVTIQPMKLNLLWWKHICSWRHCAHWLSLDSAQHETYEESEMLPRQQPDHLSPHQFAGRRSRLHHIMTEDKWRSLMLYLFCMYDRGDIMRSCQMRKGRCTLIFICGWLIIF